MTKKKLLKELKSITQAFAREIHYVGMPAATRRFGYWLLVAYLFTLTLSHPLVFTAVELYNDPFKTCSLQR